MTDIQFTSQLTTTLHKACATDRDVIEAAQVSTKGGLVLLDTDGTPMTEEKQQGLIRFLMKNRHGTPFEHNMFRFFVHAPIAVFREWHRHRIGFSYNEESGRYKQLDPVFYVPPRDRPLVQVGPPGHYTFEPGTEAQYEQVVTHIKQQCTTAYWAYQEMLDLGVAREVARGVLPVYIYSSMWVTCNARSLMAMLSLRTTMPGVHDYYCEWPTEERWPAAQFPSFPMWEIEQAALPMDLALMDNMPLTHDAFRLSGSVAP